VLPPSSTLWVDSCYKVQGSGFKVQGSRGKAQGAGFSAGGGSASGGKPVTCNLNPET